MRFNDILKAFPALLVMVFIVGCNATSPNGATPTPNPVRETETGGEQAKASTRNHIFLEVSSGQDDADVSVNFEKAADSQGPRVAELRLSLSPDLTFVSAQAGPALTEAGKDLIAQVEEDGVIRLVALSASSAAEIGSGVLATVKVRRSGSGPSTAELLLDRPLFAPQEATQGLLIDAKVTF